MPRAKKVAPKETQRFPIDNGAVVVIEFDPNKRPKMVYLDGVVIIGEHVCAPVAAVVASIAKPLGRTAPTEQQPFSSNFEVDENDPAYIAFKARHAPAPPDFSPEVITSEAMLKAAPGFGGIDLNAAIANAPDRTGTEA